MYRGYKGVVTSKKDKSPYNGKEMPGSLRLVFGDCTCNTLTKLINQINQICFCFGTCLGQKRAESSALEYSTDQNLSFSRIFKEREILLFKRAGRVWQSIICILWDSGCRSSLSADPLITFTRGSPFPWNAVQNNNLILLLPQPKFNSNMV